MTHYIWIFRMALREMRGGSRSFLFFIACIALGVGAVTSIHGFSKNIESALQERAKSLMAGDVEIRSHGSLEGVGEKFDPVLMEKGISSVHIRELVGMARSKKSGKSQLIEIKAITNGYPFYGTLETMPFISTQTLLDTPSVFVEESLLSVLNIEVGDTLSIGSGSMTVAAVIKKEPDRMAGAFSLGPRVLMSMSSLNTAALIQPGSRVTYRRLLKLPEELALLPLVEELKSLIADERIKVQDYTKAQRRFRRFFENTNTYLGFMGIISLLIGGLGVASGILVFLRRKMDAMAVMKCLGATSGRLFAVYFSLIMILASLGSIVGLGIAFGVQYSLHFLISSAIPFSVSSGLPLETLLLGFIIGVATAALFSFAPLIGIKDVPPSHILLRDVDQGRMVSKKWNSTLCGGAIVLAFFSLGIWQAGSFKLGMAVSGGIFLAGVLFAVGAVVLLSVLRRIPKISYFPLQRGLQNLCQPGNKTQLSVLTIGLGCTVILAVALVKMGLQEKLTGALSGNRPSFFFIDIQEDQKNRFQEIHGEQGAHGDIFPILRARLHSINGKPVKEIPMEGRKDRWMFQREYALTSQENFPKDNVLMEGEWWSAQEFRTGAWASVDQEVAKALGVGLGSTITFDVQGELLEATVTSTRDINWGAMRINFYIIFSKEVLQAFPKTYIANSSIQSGRESLLQKSIVSVFPNITAINVTAIMTTLESTLELLFSVVRTIALFSIISCITVLTGTIAVGRFERLKEMMILKTLGATRPVIIQVLAVEYAMLGCAAGIISVGMASFLSYIVLHYFMELPWKAHLVFLSLSWLSIVAVTMCAGFLSSWSIIGQKPLSILREE